MIVRSTKPHPRNFWCDILPGIPLCLACIWAMVTNLTTGNYPPAQYSFGAIGVFIVALIVAQFFKRRVPVETEIGQVIRTVEFFYRDKDGNVQFITLDKPLVCTCGHDHYQEN
jgi:hypothetical protein